MSVMLRRPQLTDRVIDLATFLSMQREIERVTNMRFSSDFTVSRSPVLQIGLRKISAATDINIVF